MKKSFYSLPVIKWKDPDVFKSNEDREKWYKCKSLYEKARKDTTEENIEEFFSAMEDAWGISNTDFEKKKANR